MYAAGLGTVENMWGRMKPTGGTWAIAVVVAGAAAVAAGTQAVGWRRRRSAARRSELGRWLVVTVNCSPEQIDQADLPDPLVRLTDHIEVRTARAPGGKGTELAARLRESAGAAAGGGRSRGQHGGRLGISALARVRGADPRQPVRQALRDAKALIETGEVLKPDAPPTARPTPGGKLMELATRRAGGEGRL